MYYTLFQIQNFDASENGMQASSRQMSALHRILTSSSIRLLAPKRPKAYLFQNGMRHFSTQH